jgi:plastocyanin
VPEKRVAEVHIIVISSMQFNPAELIIQKGDTVVFINNDLVVHDITQQPEKGWTSSNLSPGHSFKIAIRESSAYYCSIHPTMKGKLVVQ